MAASISISVAAAAIAGATMGRGLPYFLKLDLSRTLGPGRRSEHDGAMHTIKLPRYLAISLVGSLVPYTVVDGYQ